MSAPAPALMLVAPSVASLSENISNIQMIGSTCVY